MFSTLSLAEKFELRSTFPPMAPVIEESNAAHAMLPPLPEHTCRQNPPPHRLACCFPHSLSSTQPRRRSRLATCLPRAHPCSMTLAPLAHSSIAAAPLRFAHLLHLHVASRPARSSRPGSTSASASYQVAFSVNLSSFRIDSCGHVQLTCRSLGRYVPYDFATA